MTEPNELLRFAESLVAGGSALDESDASWVPINLAAAIVAKDDSASPSVLMRDDLQNLIYAARVNAIVGEPECGKSWLAFFAMATELIGDSNIAYIDFEDSERGFVDRLRALGVSDLVIGDPKRVRYLRPEAPLTARSRSQFLTCVENTSLVVIDAVTEAMSLHGLDDYRATDVAEFVRLIPRLAAASGAAVLQIDHVVKDVESRGRYATGSGHKLAGIDGSQIAMDLVEPFGRGRKGSSHLYLVKDRPGGLADSWITGKTGRRFLGTLILESDAGGAAVFLSIEPPSPGSDGRPIGLMSRISAVLESSDVAMSGRALQAQIGGNAGLVRAALGQLALEGCVSVQQGPRNSNLHSFVRRPASRLTGTP